MINKFKTRFTLLMACLLSSILIIAFVSLYISTAKRMYKDSIRILQTNINEFEDDFSMHRGSMMSKNPQNNNDIRKNYRHFNVFVNKNDFIKEFDGNGFLLNDEIVFEASKVAIESNRPIGEIEYLNLRYIKRKLDRGNNGQVISFIDYSYEKQLMAESIRRYFVIGIVSVVAIYIVSRLLTNLAIKPIEKSYLQQQSFIQNASHELRTPLTVIKSNISMSLNENVGIDEVKGSLISVEKEVNRMINLVKNLLFLASSDNENGRYDFLETNISDVAIESALLFEPLYFTNNKTLDYNIQDDIIIDGIEEQLKQLIFILLDNAKKYSLINSTTKFDLFKEKGKVVLNVRNETDEVLGKDIEHLFDRFYKGDKARTRGNESYGLGLSIAKEIVNNHKGKIFTELDGKMINFKIILNI